MHAIFLKKATQVKHFNSNYLYDLSQWFDKYFSEEAAPQQHDWILLSFTDSNTHHLSSDDSVLKYQQENINNQN